MKILFLDTETSGLSNYQDSIIEIAGVMVEWDSVNLTWDSVNQFTSLVRLDNDTVLDEKVTRITGISKHDLTSAPTRSVVQQQWAEWLNSTLQDLRDGENLLICGHSIDFDIGFLRAERWFLPDSVRLVDTLDSAKILFPDSEGINLEYLISKYNLDPKQNTKTAQLTAQLHSHRALYDTYAALLLFDCIVKRFVSLPLDRTVKQKIQERYIPLPITLYAQPIPPQHAVAHQVHDTAITHMTITGQAILPQLSERLDTIGFDTDLALLVDEIESATNDQITRVLCQIYTLCIMQRLYHSPNHTTQRPQLRFHARDAIDFLLLNSWIELFQQSENDTYNTHGIVQYVEDYIVRIDLIADHYCDFGRIITAIELYLKYTESWIDQDIKTILTRIISSYDFLVVSVQSQLIYAEYKFDPTNTTPESINIGARLSEYAHQLVTLKNLDLVSAHASNYVVYLAKRIHEMATVFVYNQYQEYLIRMRQGGIVMSWHKTDFRLSEHITNLAQHYKSLEMRSYLSEDTLFMARSILKLPEQQNMSYSSCNSHQQVTIIPTVDFTTYCQELDDISSKKPHVIITSQNKWYKHLQLYFTSQQEKKFLMVGESGSISKIISKLYSGFDGYVILKIPEADYLSSIQSSLTYGSITLIGEPYLYVKEYFKSFSKQDVSTLARIHREAVINRISTELGMPLTLIEALTL